MVTLSAFLFPVCSISTTTSQQPFFPFCILFRNFDALFDTLDDNLFRVRQAYQLLNPQGQEEAAIAGEAPAAGPVDEYAEALREAIRCVEEVHKA